MSFLDIKIETVLKVDNFKILPLRYFVKYFAFLCGSIG